MSFWYASVEKDGREWESNLGYMQEIAWNYGPLHLKWIGRKVKIEEMHKENEKVMDWWTWDSVWIYKNYWSNQRVSSKDEKFGVGCEFIYQTWWQIPGYDLNSIESIEV